jgi:hypothetical protein
LLDNYLNDVANRIKSDFIKIQIGKLEILIACRHKPSLYKDRVRYYIADIRFSEFKFVKIMTHLGLKNKFWEEIDLQVEERILLDL